MSEMLCAGGIPYRVIIPVNCDGTPVGGPIYINLTTGAVVFVAPVGLAPCDSGPGGSPSIFETDSTLQGDGSPSFPLGVLWENIYASVPAEALSAGDVFFSFDSGGATKLVSIEDVVTFVITDPTTTSTFSAASHTHTGVYSPVAHNHTGVYATPTEAKFEVITLAVSDETTALTTGTAKVTFRMPFAMTLTSVRSSLSTASSSGLVTVDVNEGGASIFSTALTIDASEKTSTTAATPAVINDTSLADDAEITIDIDTAGTGAKGLKVYLIGTR